MSNVHVKPNRHLFVNGAGWTQGADPNKYFTTVGAAVAAAAALVPAPDQTNPVLIYVFPGEYTEDVTLGRRGVHVSALPQSRSFATRIIGAVTVDLSGGVSRDANFVSLSGLRMTRLLFSGINAQKLYLNDVIVENGAAAHTMEMTNTGLDGATPSQVIAEGLTLTNFNAGAFRCLFRTGGQLEIFRGFMRKTPDTDFAIEMPGAGTPGTGFVTMTNVDVDGRISVSGNSPLTFTLSDVSTASAVAPAIVSTSTGLVVLGSVSVGCAFATAAISVAGALVSGDITFTGTGTVISAGVFVPLTQFSPKFRYVRAVAASGAVTAFDDMVEGTGGGAGITLTLPTAASMNRRTLTFKKVDAGAGAITIDAAGGELIDGALTKVLSALNDSVTILSNGVGWDIVSSVTAAAPGGLSVAIFSMTHTTGTFSTGALGFTPKFAIYSGAVHALVSGDDFQGHFVGFAIGTGALAISAGFASREDSGVASVKSVGDDSAIGGSDIDVSTAGPFFASAFDKALDVSAFGAGGIDLTWVASTYSITDHAGKLIVVG